MCITVCIHVYNVQSCECSITVCIPVKGISSAFFLGKGITHMPVVKYIYFIEQTWVVSLAGSSPLIMHVHVTCTHTSEDGSKQCRDDTARID